MSDNPLHNFALPNPNLQWKTEGSSVNNRRKGRSPVPRPIPRPSFIHQNSGPVADQVPFKLSASEEDALDGLECMDRPLIEFYNKNVARDGRNAAAEKAEKGVSAEVGDEEKKKPKIVFKLSCSAAEKGKGVVEKDGEKNQVGNKGKDKEVVAAMKGKGVVEKDGEKNQVGNKGKDKEVVAAMKGKGVVKNAGEKNKVENKGKGKEVVTEKRDVKGKEKEAVKAEKEKKVFDPVDAIDEGLRSWNLRSRAGKSLNPNMGGNGSKASGSNGSPKGKTQASASRAKDVLERIGFSVALTPREIEEDIFALGIKTSRKTTKRRPKALQNIIDQISPGNNLTNISADTYYVSPDSTKKHG